MWRKLTRIRRNIPARNNVGNIESRLFHLREEVLGRFVEGDLAKLGPVEADSAAMFPFWDGPGSIEDVHIRLVCVVWVDDLSEHLPLRILLFLDFFVEIASEKVRVFACLGHGVSQGEVVLFWVDCRVRDYLDTDEVERFSIRVLDSNGQQNIMRRVGMVRTGVSLVKV